MSIQYYCSPYAEITEKRIAAFKPRFKNGSSPIEVAKVILNALHQEMFHQNRGIW
jgi:hypothetical protein